MQIKKILIVRFSSIGDIIQCMSVVSGIKDKYPNAKIHWITRRDMASLLRIDKRIDKVWEFEKSKGLVGLIKLALQLRRERYTHIYDAHNNLRSTVVKAILSVFRLQSIFGRLRIITRSKDRIKRFLLFNFRINLFPKPNRSFDSYYRPLKKWKIKQGKLTSNYQFTPDVVNRCTSMLNPITSQKKPWITLVPSAAWSLKRWDVEYWKELITMLPNYNFVILGGHHDRFCENIYETAPERAINLAGKTSLLDSLCIVNLSNIVISGDTGFLHAADIFEKDTIALIGPTAFGFPSGKKTTILEVNLPCRPCTKDGSTKCKNSNEKQCMRDITPSLVANSIEGLSKASH